MTATTHENLHSPQLQQDGALEPRSASPWLWLALIVAMFAAALVWLRFSSHDDVAPAPVSERMLPATETPIATTPAPAARQAAPAQSERKAAPAAPSARGAREASSADSYGGVGQSIGTGHGGREWAPTSRTGFDRATRQPEQVSELRYDEHRRLVAMGILPRRHHGPIRRDDTPRAFPGGFVADPPRYR